MLQRLFAFFILLLLTVSLFSCASSKDILLFQDIDQLANYGEVRRNNPTIQRDDMLIITVSAADMNAVRPYNLMIESRPSRSISSNLSTNSQQQAYLVDNDGYINFPIFGKLNVAGKSRSELTDFLTDKIAKDVINPIINIQIINYKVTILGEVNQPGSYTIEGERVTLPEALGMAGDMTIYGKRKDVIILREVEGKREHKIVDLTSVASLDSDYYYLKQNDVVYVPPNGPQIQSSKFNRNTGVYFSVASLLLSVMVLIFK